MADRGEIINRVASAVGPDEAVVANVDLVVGKLHDAVVAAFAGLEGFKILGDEKGFKAPPPPVAGKRLVSLGTYTYEIRVRPGRYGSVGAKAPATYPNYPSQLTRLLGFRFTVNPTQDTVTGEVTYTVGGGAQTEGTVNWFRDVKVDVFRLQVPFGLGHFHQTAVSTFQRAVWPLKPEKWFDETYGDEAAKAEAAKAREDSADFERGRQLRRDHRDTRHLDPRDPKTAQAAKAAGIGELREAEYGLARVDSYGLHWEGSILATNPEATEAQIREFLETAVLSPGLQLGIRRRGPGAFSFGFTQSRQSRTFD